MEGEGVVMVEDVVTVEVVDVDVDEEPVEDMEVDVDQDQIRVIIRAHHHGAPIHPQPFNRPVRPAVALSACILQVFKLFFTPALIELIVEQKSYMQVR